MQRLKSLALIGLAGLPITLAVAAPAAAETTTTTALRTVSVQGVAKVPIAQNANQEVADSTYRQALAAAIADGQGKAEFLLSKTGSTLGVVQSLVESGGSIECNGGEEGSYQPYEGAQPDFPGNNGRPGIVQLTSSATAGPKTVTPGHRKGKPKSGKHKLHSHGRAGKGARARRSATASCSLSAEVALTYVIA